MQEACTNRTCFIHLVYAAVVLLLLAAVSMLAWFFLLLHETSKIKNDVTE